MTAPIEPTTPPAGDPPTPPTAPPADPPTEDKPLGPGGEKALQAERDARKSLEKELASLAPLKQLAQALGGTGPTGDGKTDMERLTERLTQHEAELATERTGRYRAEVAAEKGLTPAQAARLTGGTREELLADADALVALFPAAKPGTPAPDPSQGSRGGNLPDTDALIREAQGKGDWRTVISLQNQKLDNK
jgi:hypothetical protein